MKHDNISVGNKHPELWSWSILKAAVPEQYAREMQVAEDAVQPCMKRSMMCELFSKPSEVIYNVLVWNLSPQGEGFWLNFYKQLHWDKIDLYAHLNPA